MTASWPTLFFVTSLGYLCIVVLADTIFSVLINEEEKTTVVSLILMGRHLTCLSGLGGVFSASDVLEVVLNCTYMVEYTRFFGLEEVV